MEEPRYTAAQIALVAGTDPAYIMELRRLHLVEWHQKGYTLEEVRSILKGYPLLERAEINPRAFKALELYDRLTKGGPA